MKLFKKSLLPIAILITYASVTTSCKKFLDQQPISELGPTAVFSDVENTRKALAGVYSRLMGDQAYGIRLSLYFTVDNDETQGPSGGSDNDRRDLARYLATPGNAQITKPFQQLFQGIDYANTCIQQIPKMDLYEKGSDQEKAQLKRMYGEALTLRALFYLEAIRNWGDLPAHFTPASSLATSDPFPIRVGSDTLYDQLLADLRLAEDLVPWRSQVTSIGDQIDERITKGAVKGLRARIALFRGGYALRRDGVIRRGSNYLNYYQIARDETNEIMQSGEHGLNPSFKALWKNQVCAHAVADPDGELMLQASAIGGNGTGDSKLGYYNGPTVASSIPPNVYGNKSINILATYFFRFDSTDQRRDVTCAPYTVQGDGVTKTGVGLTAVNDGKYRRDWITNPTILTSNAIQYFGLKWQILRYSDVLLMYAEAENEINGATAEAYNAINQVRRRGFGKPVNVVDASVDIPAGLSKEDFFKHIVRERSLEFGGEGIRKYDLLRWNLLGTAVAETRANMERMSTYTPLENPTYMAPYPSYCISPDLAKGVYYIQGTTADDASMWANSFYFPAPSSTPPGTTKVTWLGTSLSTTANSRFATGFTTGKSELLPIPQPAIDANFNLLQNPGY